MAVPLNGRMPVFFGTEPLGSALGTLRSNVLMILNRMFLQNTAPPEDGVPKGKVRTHYPELSL